MPTSNTHWTTAHQMAEYRQYAVEMDYEWNDGTLQSPVAGPPGTPCDVIQICAPYGSLSIAILATRVGSKPQFPHPRQDDPNIVLAFHHIVTTTPVTDQDGHTQVFSESAIYRYHLLLPISPEMGYKMAAPPYDDRGNNYLSAQDFTDGII